MCESANKGEIKQDERDASSKEDSNSRMTAIALSERERRNGRTAMFSFFFFFSVNAFHVSDL